MYVIIYFFFKKKQSLPVLVTGCLRTRKQDGEEELPLNSQGPGLDSALLHIWLYPEASFSWGSFSKIQTTTLR